MFVDGVIGPWFLKIWQQLAKKGNDVRYVILQPDREETVRRGLEREARAEFPLTRAVFEQMWDSFADLGGYAVHAVDTTGQTAKESAEEIFAMLEQGAFRLG